MPESSPTHFREGVRVTEPHRPGCWGHEAGGFCCPDGREWRDKSGRRRTQVLSGKEWYRFKCNDPDCPAVALIRWDVLTAFVNSEAAG